MKCKDAGRGSFENAFGITRLANLHNNKDIDRHANTASICIFVYCIVPRVSGNKKKNKIYLFLFMGIDYQFYLHLRYLERYILWPFLKHSRLF
jgi:hypothetical protein